MARFPGRGSQGTGHRDNLPKKDRWLTGPELELWMAELDWRGEHIYGLSRQEARELTLKAVQSARENFYRVRQGGSPDAGLIKG